MHHVLDCLKKDLVVNIKGYMCNYDFMQGPLYSFIWIGWMIIAFVEGVFAKYSVIITWQENFYFSLSLKWNYLEKEKNPLNSKSFLCVQNNSSIFCQINFLHNIKVVDLEKLNNFHVGNFFLLSPNLEVILIFAEFLAVWVLSCWFISKPCFICYRKQLPLALWR